MAPMETHLVPLIGPRAAALIALLWRVYAIAWLDCVFVLAPLGIAVQVNRNVALEVVLAGGGALLIGLLATFIVVNKRLRMAVREHVTATYGFTPRFTQFRNATSAYGWLRLDQLYQAAGLHFTAVGTSKAYGTRWSRPELIRQMEAKLRAEGRSLPPSLPIPGGWPAGSGGVPPEVR